MKLDVLHVQVGRINEQFKFPEGVGGILVTLAVPIGPSGLQALDGTLISDHHYIDNLPQARPVA